MPYKAPTTEQLFALTHAAGVEALAGHERFAAAEPDMVEAIVRGAGTFAEGHFAPLDRIGDTVGAKWDHGRVILPEGYRAAYQAFVEGGWGSVTGPVDFGGMGLPFAIGSVVFECLGSANMAFSLCPMLTGAAIEALIAHGTEAQRETYLGRLVSGEWPSSMQLTEPQAGSDVGALRASAEPLPNGKWSIKGTKIFITFGEHELSDNIVHLVLARTPGAAAGTKGISLFLTSKYRVNPDGTLDGRNAIECVSIEHKMGINASPTCILSYGEDGVCEAELVGEEFGGIKAMFTMMNNARLNVGNEGVQVAERATQRALDYAGTRIQSARADGSSGKEPVVIIEHPDVRRMLLRMKALTQGARALVYYAAGQVDARTLGIEGARTRLDLLTPLAKAYGTDVGCEVASIGIQVHGGMGFIEETGAAQHYRDVRITPIYEGTNGIQAADLVGRKLTGDGGAGLFALLAEIRAEAGDEAKLMHLADAVEDAARWMLDAEVNDRLAGSYPFLTMMSVLTAGWLLARQGKVAAAGDEDNAFLKAKAVTVRYYLDQLVPEALGLAAQAKGGASILYALDAEELAG